VKIQRLPALLCAFIVLTGLVKAQDQEELKQKDKMASFMDSVAGTVYTLAWPTATYKSWEFDDFRRTQGGYKLVVKLSGLSGFDDSDLWLKLGFLLNSDGLKDVWVVDHNAILMAPFKTSKAIGALGLQLANQYAQSHPVQPAAPEPPRLTPSYTPAQAGAVCIVNATNDTLNFSYRWGIGSWNDGSVEAGKAYVMWWSYASPSQQSSPQFEIEYDDNLAPGYTPQRYALDRYSVSLPATCVASKQYRFTEQGSQILLNGAN
jgi:hypothetical protein